MNKLNLASPWENVREKLKETNLSLTDDDLHYQPGDEDALLQRLAAKMNKSPEAIRDYIESVSATSVQAG